MEFLVTGEVKEVFRRERDGKVYTSVYVYLPGSVSRPPELREFRIPANDGLGLAAECQKLRNQYASCQVVQFSYQGSKGPFQVLELMTIKAMAGK